MTKPIDRERLAVSVRRYRQGGQVVLIAEDDDDAREMMARILGGDGGARRPTQPRARSASTIGCRTWLSVKSGRRPPIAVTGP